MAEDLKPSLQRVITNKGKKKFFFAYGTGKRKDGKGDGALLVGAKKLKKNEVEDECACQQYFEGFCWSSAEGDVLYFSGKGKKLSPMIVSKMALTAKKETGKQYDFQVPSDEEEAKAAKLAEGDEGQETPGESPQQDDAAAARFKERVTKATAQLKALKSSDPARAQALAGLLAQAFSLTQMKPPQYADALLRLDEFDKQVEAPWTGGTAPPPTTEQPIPQAPPGPHQKAPPTPPKPPTEPQA